MDIDFIDPEKALMETEVMMKGIPSVDLFRAPQYQKLREAWCAGMFGLGYQKYVSDCRVGVNTSDIRIDADFFLRVDNKDWAFQIAEVQEPSRKRGDEYKGFADGSIKTMPYEPEKGHKEGPDWLKKIVEKKVSKNYADSQNLNLLIYANFSARQLDYTSVKVALAPHAQVFASIWVLTSTHLCCVYSNPKLGDINGWGKIRDLSHYYE